MIPNDFIQTLLSRVDIVDVIDRYVPLKKAGANLQRLLPVPQREDAVVHGEPDQAVLPLLRLRRARHGDRLPDGVRRQDVSRRGRGARARRRPRGAARRASGRVRAARAGAAISPRSRSTAAKFYRAQLKDAPRAIDYLKDRGLTGAIAAQVRHRLRAGRLAAARRRVRRYDDPALETAGLVIAGDGGKRYDRFRDRIMFPIHDSRGQVIGFGGRVLGDGEPKYLNSPETPLFSKGRELYGLFLARSAIRDAGTVVVVEGYMDVVALAQHGVDYAVATLGTATTPVHVQKLFRQTDSRRLLLRRRRRGAQGRVARARECAAGARRRQERGVPVPARGRGPGRLRAQARQSRRSRRCSRGPRRCRSFCCPSSRRSIRRRPPRAARHWSPPPDPISRRSRRRSCRHCCAGGWPI